MRRLLANDWAPAGFVFVSVPLLTGFALWAPAWLEWLAAAVGAVALLLLGLSRRQVLLESLLVVATGALAELVFAHFLGWYDYVQWAVPPWVPVGHGLVWMAARTMPLPHLSRWLLAGLLISSQLLWMLLHWQLDAIGLLVGLVPLLVAVFAGLRSCRFIFALALLVWWVEICGASLFGVWHWSPSFMGLPEISPPGSAAGGYLWLIELPALAVWFASRRLIVAFRRLRPAAPA